jgi:arylsulfatase A-like enzyme
MRISPWIFGSIGLVGVLAGGLALWRVRPPPTPVPLPDDRPNFLVIVPDTLRGDRVGAVRDGAPVTPNLDALAARGARFDHMYSQAGWTLPALATLLSGRWPLARPEGPGPVLEFMDEARMTLPEALTSAGYHTAVFWGPYVSSAAPEFSRGFTDVAHETAEPYEKGLLGWLAEADRRPFFALVHNADLQFPVVPVRGDPLLATPLPAAHMGLQPTFDMLAQRVGPERADAAVEKAYDAAITYYDAAIGRMLAGVARAGLAEHTVVIVTSNHGVDLGEHGQYLHGTLYDTNLHVPLIVADAAIPRKGRRIDTAVQTLDVAPTIFARAGLTPPPGLPGGSLLPLLGVGTGAYTAQEVYSVNNTRQMSVRTPRYKVTVSASKTAGDGTAETEIFDLDADPLEQTALPTPYPAEASALAARLGSWWQARSAEAALARGGGEDSAALKKALRDNGYWGVATGSAKGTGGRAVPADP